MKLSKKISSKVMRIGICWCSPFLLLFILCCKGNKKETLEESGIDFDKAFHNYHIANKYLDENKDTLLAIDHFIKSADYGFEPIQAYSNAIVYSLHMDQLDLAMDLAFKMATCGFRNLRAMDQDYFSKLKTHPKWEDLKSAIEANAKAYNKNLRDFNNAKLVVSDIHNFWKAYDLASQETEFSSKRAIYLREYFDKGTVGLRDFTFLKMPNGINQFVEFVESHRSYYDGIRKASIKALMNLSKMDVCFEKLDSIIPNATFPNYYFVIGCHTSFGTVSINGSLIGLENVIDETTPIDTLPEYRVDVVAPADFLPFVLIHELIHTYQNLSDKTLLGATIVEGGADFFTEMVVGEPNPKPKYRTFGEANEKIIFNEFKENLDNTKHINWIAGRDDEKKSAGLAK